MASPTRSLGLLLRKSRSRVATVFSDVQKSAVNSGNSRSSCSNAYEPDEPQVERRGKFGTSLSNPRQSTDSIRETPKSSGVDRMLKDVVHRPSSHAALYSALRRHTEALSLRNAATALYSLAHLDMKAATSTSGIPVREGKGAANQRNAQAMAAEQSLAKHLENILLRGEELAPRTYSDLMWSLSKFGLREPFGTLIGPLREKLPGVIDNLSGRDVVTVLWAVATMELDATSRSEFVIPLFEAVQAKSRANELGAHDLAQSLWSCAKLEVAGERNVRSTVLALIEASTGKTSEFKPHSLSVSTWSLGILDGVARTRAGEIFVKELLESVESALPVMNAQMVANCAWGAARIGVPPGSFYDAVADRAKMQLSERNGPVTEQNVCNIVWAFAKVEARTPKVLAYAETVAEEFSRTGVENMANHNAAGTAWGLARIFFQDQVCVSPTGYLPDAVSMFISLVTKAAKSAILTASWDARTLCMTAWAVARAELAPEAQMFFPEVVQHISQMPSVEVGLSDITMLLWAIATAEMNWQDFSHESLEEIFRKGIRLIESGQADSDDGSYLSGIAWSCASADFRGSAGQLIRATAKVAQRALDEDKWVSKPVVMVSWALVVQHQYTPETAKFIRSAFLTGIRDLQSAGAGYQHGGGNSTPFIDQMETLRLALLRDTGLLALVPRLPCRFAATPVQIYGRQTPIIDVTISGLQEAVLATLKKLRLPGLLSSEAVLECGVTVDILLDPPDPPKRVPK